MPLFPALVSSSPQLSECLDVLLIGREPRTGGTWLQNLFEGLDESCQAPLVIGAPVEFGQREKVAVNRDIDPFVDLVTVISVYFVASIEPHKLRMVVGWGSFPF